MIRNSQSYFGPDFLNVRQLPARLVCRYALVAISLPGHAVPGIGLRRCSRPTQACGGVRAGKPRLYCPKHVTNASLCVGI